MSFIYQGNLLTYFDIPVQLVYRMGFSIPLLGTFRRRQD